MITKQPPTAARLQYDLLGAAGTEAFVAAALAQPSAPQAPVGCEPRSRVINPGDDSSQAPTGKEKRKVGCEALPSDRPGGPVRAAAAALGVNEAVVAGWGAPADPAQDWRVESEGGRPVRVAREGGGATETVVVEVDGSPSVWVAPPGPATLALPVGTRTAAIDPAGRAQDAARDNNRGPPRWHTIAAGWVTDISPSQDSFTAWANLALRRQGDTRNLYLLAARHDPQDLVSLSVGYVRSFGPLVDRRVRRHRIVLSAGPSLLNEEYRSTAEGEYVLGGGAAYSYDSRTGNSFAISGRRMSVGFGGGTRLGVDEQWASAGGTWVEFVPIHPRHVLAARARLGWASGEVEHRLLPLGGASAVRSVPDAAVLGNQRIVGNLEYRWAALRDLSVPLPLAWLAEVKLVPGFDAGAVWADGVAAPEFAAGATLGVYTVLDVFGARPTLVGAVAAFPVAVAPVASPEPQVYFSFDQSF